MTPRYQGTIGEASAIQWLASKGLPVAVPVGHSPNWDVVTEIMGELVGVQVKTSTSRRNGRWVVSLCTRGGNRSGNGSLKRFSATRCDYLFAHVADGRRWFIPANHLEGTIAVVLGGKKYGQFEVERGEPLAPLVAPRRAA